MYKSIYEMAVNLGLEPTPGFRKKLVKAHIVLDESGNYQRISESERDDKTLCPDKPFQLKGFTGNSSAQFLADYPITVLFSEVIAKNDQEIKKFTPKHQNFVNQVQLACDEGIEIIKPISVFLNNYDSDEKFRNEIIREISITSLKLSSDIISFRIGTKNVETDTSWLDYYKRMAGLVEDNDETSGKYFSSVTGKDIAPITGKFPMWRGGKAGSGVPIFASSMRGPGDSQLAATKSYGSLIDCPMSENEANTIVSGLDYVLNEVDQYDPDFGIFWWYDSKVEEDIIRRTVSKWQKIEAKKKAAKDPKIKAHERALEDRKKSEDFRELLEAAEKGFIPKTFKSDYKYHIASVSFPSKGRMFFENEYSDTYESLYQNLNKWYTDSAIETSYYDGEKKEYKSYDKLIKNVFEIMYALKLNSKDGGKDGKYNMYHKEKAELIKAVYAGTQIPNLFFKTAVDQYTRFVGFNSDSDDTMGRHISEENAACILELEKIFLLRNGGYEMGKELTPDNSSIGYQCGRWLAVIDKLQDESLKQSGKKVNRTLSSRFYKQAKKSPAKAFSLLDDYIKVYEDRLTNYKSVYEKKFGEISEKIGTYFPERLSVKEQGAFDLGFAQQKQSFYKKNEETSNEIEEKTEEI